MVIFSRYLFPIVFFSVITFSCTTVTKEQRALALEYYKIAQLYEQEFNDRPEAILQYMRALNIHPAFEEAAYALAVLYVQDKKYPQAQELVERILRLNSSAQVDSLQAYLLLAQSEYKMAEQIYTKLVEEGIADYHVYYNLALIYEEVGREADVVEMLETVLELNSSFIPAHVHLALIAYENAEYTNVVIGLENLSTYILEYPNVAFALAESYLYLENYVSLFEFMDKLYEEYLDGSDFPESLLISYQELIIATARSLGTIAIDDEQSLGYFHIIHENNIFSLEDWVVTLETFKNIKGLDQTIAFISEQIPVPEEELGVLDNQ